MQISFPTIFPVDSCLWGPYLLNVFWSVSTPFLQNQSVASPWVKWVGIFSITVNITSSHQATQSHRSPQECTYERSLKSCSPYKCNISDMHMVKQLNSSTQSILYVLHEIISHSRVSVDLSWWYKHVEFYLVISISYFKNLEGNQCLY